MGLWLLHLKALHEPTVLLWREFSDLAFAPRPLVDAAFQALVQQNKTVLLPVQPLDPIPAPTAEQEQRVGERIQVELLLYHGGQPIDALAQIRIAAGDEDAVCAGEVM